MPKFRTVAILGAVSYVAIQAGTNVNWSHFGQGQPAAAPQYSAGGGQTSCPKTQTAAAVFATSVGAGIQAAPVCLGTVGAGRHWFTVEVANTSPDTTETLRLAGYDDSGNHVPLAWFGHTSVQAGPGQSRTVRDYITVPASARPGRRHGELEVTATVGGSNVSPAAGAATDIIFTIAKGAADRHG